jgi:hypothetical protein
MPGNSQWRELRPKDGGFNVQMPGDATTQKPLVNPGGVAKLTELHGIHRNHIGYLAGFANVPAEKLAKGAAAWLDDCKSRFVKLNKAKVINESTVKVDDYPGRELTVEFTLKSSGVRQTSKVRMYLVKERYYFLQALASKRHGLPNGTDEFLDSFALNDSPNAKTPPGGFPGRGGAVGGLAQGGFPGRAGLPGPGGVAGPGGNVPPAMTRGARAQATPAAGAPNANPQAMTRGARGRPGAPTGAPAEPPTTAGGPNATPPLALRGIKGRLPAANARPGSPPEAKPKPADSDDATTSWSTYTSVEGRFEVRLPGKPNEAKQKVKGPEGEVEVNVIGAEGGDAGVFAVIFLDAPDVSKAKTLVESPIDPSMATVGLPNGGSLKVVDDSKKVIDGHPTRTLLLEPTETKPGQEANTVESRIVVVEKRVYMLYSVRPKGKERTKEVDRFFDSFKIMSKQKLEAIDRG